VPITLHSDLVRLTKLAKVGQQNLIDSTKQCCSGSADNPFAPFINSLEGAIAAAVVNATAIAEALVSSFDPGHDMIRFESGKNSAIAGRLIINGGIEQCKGTYETLSTGEKVELFTDSLGSFEVEKPQLAQYRFSGSIPGSVCRDAITGVTIRFPMTLFVPAVALTVINPISLLTVPAADDMTVAKLYRGRVSDGRAPPFLWTHAYKILGYDAGELEVSGWVVAGNCGAGCVWLSGGVASGVLEHSDAPNSTRTLTTNAHHLSSTGRLPHLYR